MVHCPLPSYTLHPSCPLPACRLHGHKVHFNGFPPLPACRFHGLSEPHETPWPRQYIDFEHPLPANSVRLLVIPLEASPALSTTASVVTKSILDLLPQGIKVGQLVIHLEASSVVVGGWWGGVLGGRAGLHAVVGG